MKEFIFFLKNFYLKTELNPIQLFIILFLISMGKSTIFLSYLIPPASIMLINFIIFSLPKMNVFLIFLSITLGSTSGSIISYNIGKKITQKKIFLKYLKKYHSTLSKAFYKLKKKETSILFISKFIAILRYIIPFASGILLIKKKKTYTIFLFSSIFWSIFLILISKIYFLFF